MLWTKRGLIFEPPRHLGWMHSHAALPFADPLDERIRVYFSGRDRDGRAQIGFWEVDIRNPQAVLRVSDQPVIAPGRLGTFDDSGVTNSWLVNYGEKKYLYYSGWARGVTVPFYLFVGLAISEDGGLHFHKVSDAPILERVPMDPYLTASPCVLVEEGLWRMWYVSGTSWEAEEAGPKHYYHIKYAESADGIRWDRKGIVCVDYRSPSEFAIARPCVLKEGGIYKMWYSCRGTGYVIGYAESQDGKSWRRLDSEAGIQPSDSGWDSEMIEYPHVFDYGAGRYMLYNGNGFGRTGIGLAVMEEG
jgi:hypothetical protein